MNIRTIYPIFVGAIITPQKIAMWLIMIVSGNIGASNNSLLVNINVSWLGGTFRLLRH